MMSFFDALKSPIICQPKNIIFTNIIMKTDHTRKRGDLGIWNCLTWCTIRDVIARVCHPLLGRTEKAFECVNSISPADQYTEIELGRVTRSAYAKTPMQTYLYADGCFMHSKISLSPRKHMAHEILYTNVFNRSK